MAAALLMAVVSCKKDNVNPERVNITFETSLEKPEPESEQGDDMFDPYAKNFLVMERYVYWDPFDTVAVFAGLGSADNPDPDQVKDVQVMVQSNERYADINCSGIKRNEVYYGMFPARSRVGGDPSQMEILSSYTYRDNNSFPKPGIPMVAWDNDPNTDAPALDFHSVCGLVRLQLTSNTQVTVKQVSFTEIGGEKEYSGKYSTHPISGRFTVNDIDTYTPYLTAQNKVSRTKVRIYDINQLIGNGKLLTLYLPLPATQATGIPEEKDSYVLGMTVVANDGKKDVTFKKVFHVRVRRNTMSFMRTLTIIDWDGGNVEQGLVGEGTETRPFQIYTAGDMEVVRNAFNDNPSAPSINGIAITKNTVFRLVRSNIELTASTWTEGIRGFKGKFTFQTANDQVGITNNSSHPIFESISADGYVEDLHVKRDNSATYSGTAAFSPFCNENSGTLKNCHNLASITSNNGNLAGLCVSNTSTGKILGCSNTANITVNGTEGKAAGICLNNAGIIECYELSIARVNAAQAGGVCHTNSGTIQNTQVTYSRADVANPYGGIAYLNTGTIDRCQVLGTLASRSSIGGICHNNQGIVTTCRNGLASLIGSGMTGGIVAQQTNTGAPEIRNCFNSAASTANVGCSSGDVGGIVAQLRGGNVFNCYSTLEVASANATNYGAIAGDVRGGSVQNCYNGNALAPFYGNAAANPIGVNCFNPTAVANCCVFNPADGKIISLTNSSNGAVGGQIKDALNAWVNSHGSNYLSWGNGALPTFAAAK